MKSPEDPKQPSSGYRLLTLGTELVAAVAGGSLVGWWIDRQYQTRYGLLIGALVGIVGGLYNLIKQSYSVMQEQQAELDRQDEGNDSAAD
ncbi:MAG: hypothetical protein HJJLKODD_00986 [Phycisphaerae bacterium]|nr:hypothetical protein [Phycisphaerae bacterium]